VSYNKEETMGSVDNESERLDLLHRMGSLTRMRRGTVNVQSFTKRRKDGSVITQGPYYLYSRTEKRRSYSQRIPEDAVERYRTETENCRRFKELAQQYILVCERLTALSAAGKKNSRRPSPRRSSPKSRPS
jgi:hypothetical protein